MKFISVRRFIIRLFGQRKNSNVFSDKKEDISFFPRENLSSLNLIERKNEVNDLRPKPIRSFPSRRKSQRLEEVLKIQSTEKFFNLIFSSLKLVEKPVDSSRKSNRIKLIDSNTNPLNVELKWNQSNELPIE